MYEPSIRVPLLMECPSMVRQPAAVEAMTTTLDILPTLLDVAGEPVPEGYPGRSLKPWIEGREVPWKDEFVYCYYWEREAPMTPTIFGLRTRTESFITTQGVWDRQELYDVEADPLQKRNLLGPYLNGMNYGRLERAITDPAMRKRYLDLDARLDAAVRALGGSRQASHSAR